MGKKKKDDRINEAEARKETRKLLKVMVLLAKVYRKGAKTQEQKSAYKEIADKLEHWRKEA